MQVSELRVEWGGSPYHKLLEITENLTVLIS